MAQSWWGVGYRAIPLKGTTSNMLNPSSAAQCPLKGHTGMASCVGSKGEASCATNQALVHFGAGGVARGGWGAAGRVTGQRGDVPAGQSGQIQPGVAAKSVGWHFSTTVSTEIIKHCVGNPEQHPSCSVCRWNPACVQVPAAPPARPLSPPDSILLRLYPCATPPRWGSRAINAKCALLLG